MSGNTPGKRAAARPEAARGLTPAVVLAVAAPVVATLALLVQAPADDQRDEGAHRAETRPLTTQALACPAAPGSRTVLVASDTPADASGQVFLREVGQESRPVRLPRSRYAAAPAAAGPMVLDARDDLAAGLYAARHGVGAPAAGECTAPAGERWFVGAGSGAEHLSSVQLVNPDRGPAVADLTLWSTDGPLEAPRALGITVPGGRSRTIDLEEIAPHRHELAVRVTVTRGRVAATVADAFGFDGGSSRADWIAATEPPAASLVLPGLVRSADERVLVLANPGESEGRVTLRVVGARGTFTPTGVEEVRVPAGRVVVTDLTRALASALRQEDASLEVTSTVPVTAGLRSVVDGDVVHQAALPATTGAGAAIVPPGGATALVLNAREQAGSVTVTFVGSAGRSVRSRLQPGTTRSVAVPAGTVAVRVDAAVPWSGALRTVGGSGAALLPLRALVTDRLIPSVRPAWPPGESR